MELHKLTDLFEFLSEQHHHHSRDSHFYKFTDLVIKEAFDAMKIPGEISPPIPLGELGEIIFPYEKLGAVDSIDLFGLDELIMFAFYYKNRKRYQRALDIGANIGLHSLIMAKCGYHVAAYEPDPNHFERLCSNLTLNGVSEYCQIHQAAISEQTGTADFVRVLGNTTSSHLAGAKSNAYGELAHFSVSTIDIKNILVDIDLIKIDAEGHEATILKAIPLEAWRSIDVFVEVGTEKNAEIIFAAFAPTNVNLFSQKTGWNKVLTLNEMPFSYHEGSLFLSMSQYMNWTDTIMSGIHSRN